MGPGNYDGYKNYGQYRSAQVHERNAARQAARGNYDNYGDWYNGGYSDNGYYYDDYETRYQVIRNIVYDRNYNSYYNDYSSYYPSYDAYYYDTPYEPIYGSPLTVNYIYYGIPYNYVSYGNYGYASQYGYGNYDPYYYSPYYGGAYSSYTSYSTYYYDPYSYSGYGPSYVSYGYPSYGYADYSYSNYGYSNYGYSNYGYSNYGYPYQGYADYGYAGYGNNSYGGILNSLPVGDLVSELAGNSFVSELLSGFLTQGYDQGYIAGQYARDYGYDEEAYYDPYAYNETNYDTYSINLAENRRIFSEGYEAGYRDALQARNDEAYYPYEDSQPDLVSLLVGNVLSGI